MKKYIKCTDPFGHSDAGNGWEFDEIYTEEFSDISQGPYVNLFLKPVGNDKYEYIMYFYLKTNDEYDVQFTRGNVDFTPYIQKSPDLDEFELFDKYIMNSVKLFDSGRLSEVELYQELLADGIDEDYLPYVEFDEFEYTVTAYYSGSDTGPYGKVMDSLNSDSWDEVMEFSDYRMMIWHWWIEITDNDTGKSAFIDPYKYEELILNSHENYRYVFPVNPDYMSVSYEEN